ncbi:autoinducer binding domain-containing protein [Rhodovulum sulfidophilum]|uniref:autoinducer binding domain-containing protein n=1 Tax=Rhodovulum sulfidophilum TaxID=35806 RepID=UPI001922928E|nr:autoinducer binding domain-containing protein [Rhodovulum sulfidophilum]MBL3564259.1 autoinducer binding domain-containing protein [Rhodovulum sulfidophilum]
MNRVNKVAELLEMLQRTCDTGFVLALHVRFTRPLVLYRTYPQSWCDHYDLNGLVMLDPAVRWSFCNTGVIQWDDPSLDDPGGVVEAARAHGVANGVSVSVGSTTSRSLGGFSRSSGRFDAADMDRLSDLVETLHLVLDGVSEDEQGPELRALRALSTSVLQP